VFTKASPERDLHPQFRKNVVVPQKLSAAPSRQPKKE